MAILLKCKDCGITYDARDDHKCQSTPAKPAYRVPDADKDLVIAQSDGPPEARHGSERLKFGEPCPCCGAVVKPRPKTNAERQRAWRERRKGQ